VVLRDSENNHIYKVKYRFCLNAVQRVQNNVRRWILVTRRNYWSDSGRGDISYQKFIWENVRNTYPSIISDGYLLRCISGKHVTFAHVVHVL